MPRKKSKKNYYFTSVHEDAIVEYCSTESREKREKLYIQFIQPAFSEMVDKIINIFCKAFNIGKKGEGKMTYKGELKHLTREELVDNIFVPYYLTDLNESRLRFDMQNRTDKNVPLLLRHMKES